MVILKRLARRELPAIRFVLDGVACEGRAGDTIMTAALTLRRSIAPGGFFRNAPRGLLPDGRVPGLLGRHRRRSSAARLHDTPGARHAAADAIGGAVLT